MRLSAAGGHFLPKASDAECGLCLLGVPASRRYSTSVVRSILAAGFSGIPRGQS